MIHPVEPETSPNASTAPPVLLNPQMDTREGFHAIARNCLAHLLANYPLVVARGDAEALHQSRIAIRRLRAAFALFRRVTNDPQAAVLRAEWKAVAGRLGPARDMQVLCDLVSAQAAESGQDCADLLAHLAAHRDEAIGEARHMLGSAAFQRLLQDFAAWLEAGNWLTSAVKRGGDEPITAFARHAIAHRLHKVLRHEGDLATMSDAARHRLRIKVKKLRYGVGFFASLQSTQAGAARQTALAKVLGRVQDSLGELNDLAVAPEVAEASFAGLDPITRARFAAQLQKILEQRAHDRRRLVKAAERALKSASRHAEDRRRP
ncbi:CHAD domain-containing protein [Alteraurantiacibacter palmitatis]|uniref:CHAD domain-containing protein n=1 Tax=Alteraurantiacibacter palmitatis TaxID=2054628 RepID=A0ABV7E2R3_9SPHN